MCYLVLLRFYLFRIQDQQDKSDTHLECAGSILPSPCTDTAILDSTAVIQQPTVLG